MSEIKRPCFGGEGDESLFKIRCENKSCPALSCEHAYTHGLETCKKVEKKCNNKGIRCISTRIDICKDDNIEKEIEIILNKYSAENRSNTPDFVLAKYLLECLNAFNSATKSRDQWYEETK